MYQKQRPYIERRQNPSKNTKPTQHNLDYVQN